jgi:hypothetical protein
MWSVQKNKTPGFNYKTFSPHTFLPLAQFSLYATVVLNDEILIY